MRSLLGNRKLLTARPTQRKELRSLFPELPPTQAAQFHAQRRKSSVPELKGLVTKACDILRLQNPCVVNPLSVTRECSDFTREMRLVSWHGVSVAFQPGGHPGKAMGLGGRSNQQLGGAFLGSVLKSPLSQACNFRDTINTHPGNPQIYSREGNLMLSWWRL